MKVYTIQLGQWRKVKAPTVLVDITLKSGNKAFSPDGALFTYYRATHDKEYYVEEYKRLMKLSLKEKTAEWIKLCNMDDVAVACYCPEGAFCHRYQFVEMLRKVCLANHIPFSYEGEYK